MFQRDAFDRGKHTDSRGSGRKRPEDTPEASDLPPIPDYDELDLSWGKATMPDLSDEPATSLPVAELSADKVYAAADAVDSTDATVISLADKDTEEVAESDQKDASDFAGDSAEGDAKKRSLWVPLVVIFAILALLAAAGFAILNFTNLFAGDIAASVNGDIITIAELDERLELIAAQNPVMFDTEAGGLEEGMARHLVLSAMIEDILLIQEADKEGINITDADVQALIDDRAANYPNWEAFEEDLRANSLTLEQFKEQVWYGLTVEALLHKLVPDDEITDEEVQEYYEEFIEFYTEPATDDDEERVLPLEEVAASIHDMLLQTLRNMTRGDLLERLRTTAEIEIFDPVVLAFIEEENLAEASFGEGDEEGEELGELDEEEAP
ncbi:MAG: SurA N-terminal domain-containing protein [Coriobacteriia bacterium]|nr:SurA N-terminal domain-containing protein [Coriobacteriia bacterium]